MIIFTEVNKNNRYSINNKKLMKLINKYKNFLIKNCSFWYEYDNFKNYYIEYQYKYNTLMRIKYFNYLNYLHRDDGPAYIYYDSKSEIPFTKYYLNGRESSYEDYLKN